MKTNTVSLKPASFGTVSHGTLRTEDLLSAFISELEWQIRRNGDYFSAPENFPHRDRLNNLVGEAQDCFAEDGNSIDPEKEETADELVNESMPDALTEFAPPYGYFGTLEGDGSDFGFWVNVEDVKEQVEFVSRKDQERPDDAFRGEWLHINERGNCTLFVREGESGKEYTDREVWGVV